MKIDISDIAGDFPAFRVAVVVVSGLKIPATRPPALQQRIEAASAAIRADHGEGALADIAGVAAWRRTYRQFGIKKTSYRSSVERLVKNALAGRELPVINPFVDAYNAVSLAHVLPAGADDLANITGDIAFRYARDGDTFFDMGAVDDAGNPAASPPKHGEVVYADADRVLCRRWNWRQDARSVIRADTTGAVITLQDNRADMPSGADGNKGIADNSDWLEAAAADLADLIGQICGGSGAITIADAGQPAPDLKQPAT